MITYSTNWMGPVTMQWYRDRGLTYIEEHIADHDSMFYNIGDTYTAERITEQYSCGRIDVRGIPDEPYGTEIGVPPMRAVDWARLSLWLNDVTTVSVWSLDDLITAFEHWTSDKIVWDRYE